MTYYTAFAASSSLQSLNESFVTEIAESPTRPLTPTLIQLLELFTDECMDAYFLGPMGMIDLNPMGKKVVQGGVSAIKKTIKVALKKVLGKMSNDEIRPLADYIESLLLKPAEGSDLPTYIGVELPDELHARIMGAVEEGRNGQPKSVAKEFSIGMCALVDVSIDCYFERPMEMMSLGYLSEKIARLANESVKGGAKSVIKKVTKTMNDEELLAFFDFAESIIVDGPAQ
ncbi:hypothetical protein A9Q99_01505 [Gammaproteobacteria bacterium 45_16_T64]|nr:hypothetical protein A9Q99_01505 [Gammaproteobacteria bacterium 45_16_T64]